jgi:hypothetical protein
VPAKWALTAVDQLAPDMAANAIPIQTNEWHRYRRKRR